MSAEKMTDLQRVERMCIDLARGVAELERRLPRRKHGVVLETCDCCGLPTDSQAHINHCNS
jgi:hypothetical protein